MGARDYFIVTYSKADLGGTLELPLATTPGETPSIVTMSVEDLSVEGSSDESP
jgi:hypothetical protein